METFELREGQIESDHTQEAVDAFAADFQALQHFGSKVGAALRFENPWMGALQEADYCVAYSSPERQLAGRVHGMGARIGERALLFELLSHITPEQS